MTGDWGTADNLTIPERGDGIPDLLQEAIWGIEVFKRLQTEDGGIPGGIEQEAYRGFGEASWSEHGRIYAYAPDVWSSWEYAAAAAKVAHNLKAYDAVAAQDWLQTAIDAMAYAEANWQDELNNDPAARDITARNIAALELYRATGDTGYHDLFEATSVYADGQTNNVNWNEHQFEAAFLYATMGNLALNNTIRTTGIADLQGEADLLLDIGMRSGFGSIYNPYAPYGWGNTQAQPNQSQDSLVRLHHLTGDQRLLEAIQGDVQYVLGANPLNMTFMTGLDGVRGPEDFLNLDADVLGYGPVPGITLYGEYNLHDYGQGFYHDIIYPDVWPDAWQQPVSESWHAFSVYVPVTEYTVQQGILDMTYVTGYLAALSDDGGDDRPPIIGTDRSEALMGTMSDDSINAIAGSDTIRAGDGDDTVRAGKGYDEVFGGLGDDKIMGEQGKDTLRGGEGNDSLFGGGANDCPNGYLGNDLLMGGLGRDKLKGGDGADTLVGGKGEDTLMGEGGSDTFHFLAGSGKDKVFGFETSQDQVLLDAALLGEASLADVLASNGKLSDTQKSYVLKFDAGDMLILKADAPMVLTEVESTFGLL